MSNRTAPALAKLDELLAALEGQPRIPDLATLIEDAQALRRAVAAFHMEAIRFRMHSVDRLIKAAGDPPEPRRLYDELRQTLEAAGFHTRSHSAP
jgi:hypothetical protein